jgi:FtsH-binding integral membrane protein
MSFGVLIVGVVASTLLLNTFVGNAMYSVAIDVVGICLFSILLYKMQKPVEPEPVENVYQEVV